MTYAVRPGGEDTPMSPALSAPIRTLGIFGAGKSGVAIARVALAAGYQVRIATSGPADRTVLLTSIVTPGAIAVGAEELSAQSDAIVLAVPLRKWRELPLPLLAGQVVIDVMNYWPPVDGILPEFEADRRPTSQVVGDALPPTARLVKTFNHIGYHEIEVLARPAGSNDRIALAIAGDDNQAVEAVARLVDDVGFDPVAVGRLSQSGALQPGSRVFGANLNLHRLRSALTAPAFDQADGVGPAAVCAERTVPVR